MRHWLSRNKTGLSVLAALVVWASVFYFLSPDDLVAKVGIGNAYIVSFLVSLAAGFSFFTGTAAYATVIQFSRGGVHPLYLGLAAGLGLFLSDSAFYLLLMRGRRAFSRHIGRYLGFFHRRIEKLPPMAIYIGVYLFCAFGPIPNDAIIAFLIIAGYEYKKVWFAILAGDITFMLFLSYLFSGT